MTKITIEVYKSYRNSEYRNHRQKTKKHWCHYFLDIDDYDEEDGGILAGLAFINY